MIENKILTCKKYIFFSNFDMKSYEDIFENIILTGFHAYFDLFFPLEASESIEFEQFSLNFEFNSASQD